MRILAVDTTAAAVSLALGDGRAAISRSVAAPGAHDEKIFSEIDKLLKKAGCRLSDVDGFVVASGPGSFTGIRVGMTFVSVLSQGLGKPAAAVSLLEAEAARSLPGMPFVAVVFPAGKDDLFFQLYGAAQAGAPQWIPAKEWPAAFRAAARGKKGVVLVGPAAEQAAQALGDRKPSFRKAMPFSAADLIPPGIRKLDSGNNELAPLYLKPAYYERNPPRLVR